MRSDRAHAVRRSARAWAKEGAIDRSAVGAVEALYPDDRARARLPLRILFVVLTALGLAAAFGFLVVQIEPSSDAVTAGVVAVFAAISAVLAEWQTGVLRRAETGTEIATGWLAVLLAATAVGFGMGGGGQAERHGWQVSAAIFAAVAAWRWGFPLLGAGAAAALLLRLAELPSGRAIVFVAGIGLALAGARATRSPRFPPSIRRALGEAAAVALLAAYAAINLRAIDLDGFGWLIDRPGAPPSPTWRWIGVAGTALYPVAVLAVGVRIRDRIWIAIGALSAVASLATLRFYVHAVPTWAALTLGGAAAIGGALLLRRWLDAGPGRERFGFTAEPLYESGRLQRLVETAVTVTALTPAAPPAEPAERFHAGGGSSGGGGASGGYGSGGEPVDDAPGRE